MQETNAKPPRRARNFTGGIHIRSDELTPGAVADGAGHVDDERHTVRRRDDVVFAQRSHDALDARRHGPMAFGPDERAHPPAVLEKSARDVPPDETGDARHRDGSAHAMAF
jgi:hypothetical protein